ncbi:MAG TPA: flippase activity-associated protein Agl23 [Verrucomicrobiae bacterium]
MNRPLLILILVLGAAGVALALRCPRLEERPMHNDEAVNAIKFGQLWQQGGYRYDPNEHHGPSLYYATLAVGRLTGAPDFDHYSENRLRLVTVLFGMGLILLLPLVADGLGLKGTAWAALFTAVSPAFVFYSRYFIHEMLLVFFTLLALAGGWRYWRSRKVGWILLAGAGVGLMDATKETFVLTLAAAGMALGLNLAWSRLVDASGSPSKVPPLNRRHLALACLIWAVLAIVLFSSFFTNAAGPLDSLRSYLPWIQRAEGQSPHIHPWYFYLHRLLWFHKGNGPVWTEVPVFLLAVVAVFAGFRRRRLAEADASFVRFLAFFALTLIACYSLIGYKTPWCLLSFWHPVVLLAGVGAAVLVESYRPEAVKIGARILVLIGAGYLACQAWQQDTEYAADPRNPYAYAQTSSDILDLVSAVEGLAKVSPEGYETEVKAMAPEDDYWPLPWYLRRFKQIGWYHKVPEDPYAPIIIISPALQQPLDESKAHLMGFYGLRPPQTRLALFVDPQLWTKWLSAHSTGVNSDSK